MSENAIFNNFHDWNKIYILYCDGSFHQGYNSHAQYVESIHSNLKTSPISPFYHFMIFPTYNSTKLHFNGENNTKTIFKDIIDRHHLPEASHVLLTGMSAGGVAAFFWADYLRSLLPPAVRFGAAPDSGYGLDVPDYKTKTYKLRKQVQNLFQVADSETNPPTQKCIENHPQNPFLCFFVPTNYIPYIESNLFIVNSQYDEWLMHAALGLGCISKEHSLKACPENAIFAAEQLRDIFVDSLTTIAKNNKKVSICDALSYFLLNFLYEFQKRHPVWSIACVKHVFADAFPSFSSVLYEVPQKSGNTLNKVLYQWFQSDFEQQIHIDQVSWPQNKLCSQADVGDFEFNSLL